MRRRFYIFDYSLYLVQFITVKFGKAKHLVFLDEIDNGLEREGFHDFHRALKKFLFILWVRQVLIGTIQIPYFVRKDTLLTKDTLL